MSLVQFPAAGALGVNKDLSTHELPLNAWTDASNVRFLDGMAYQFYGHSEVYATPSFAPQHLVPCTLAGVRYWIYTTAAKTYAVTGTTHTDITHLTPRTGIVNNWTSTLLSGIPVLNAGDITTVPMSWDLNLSNKFVNLANWPASTYCKSIRAYKNYLVALNITKTTTNYPYMVKWSHPADPGTVPASWDHTDATKDAGEIDLPEGSDPIVDGLQLRDSFMIYKESSCWRMDFVGGAFVFRFTKVLGTSGALNRNCIVELDGFHLVMSGSDVFIHDGQSATSVLDQQTRRDLFRNIDVTYRSLCFVVKNPFFNEALICYPSIGSTSCDKAVVWNYKDRTVSFRTLPNISHAAYGPVAPEAASSWANLTLQWGAWLSAWDGPGFVPDTTRVIMAGTAKLFLMDASASFDGLLPVAHIERRGLSFGKPQAIKLCRGVRARITGNIGDTVLIRVGSSDDPYADPTYGATMTHTIGTTVHDDCFVAGRYIAIRFETGTSFQWRLDTFELDIEEAGMY